MAAVIANEVKQSGDCRNLGLPQSTIAQAILDRLNLRILGAILSVILHNIASRRFCIIEICLSAC
jgi:hypothetical protein